VRDLFSYLQSDGPPKTGMSGIWRRSHVSFTVRVLLSACEEFLFAPRGRLVGLAAGED